MILMRSHTRLEIGMTGLVGAVDGLVVKIYEPLLKSDHSPNIGTAKGLMR